MSFYYIEEKRSPRGKFIRSGNSYTSLETAFRMKEQLDEHGGCGPLRVVDAQGVIQHSLKDYSGPFHSKEDAIEKMKSMCGVGYRALLWENEPGQFYIRTASIRAWRDIPANSEWVKI